MAPPVIRRRRDGLIEIRRRRPSDAFLVADTLILLALMIGWLLFFPLLVATLVTSPILAGIAGGFVVLGLWAGYLLRPSELAHSPADPPPRRAA